MIKFFLKIIILISVLFFPFYYLLASQPFNVVINEISWMGTENSYNNEWIELYNNLSLNLNLNGWKLISENGKLIINLKGIIPAKEFFILERNNDKILPEIKANFIYKGTLNNKGEHLKLIDKDGKIIDEVNCSLKWFAGDNKTKQTMERINSLVSGNSPPNWQTSLNIGGTPKSINIIQDSDSKQKLNKEQESFYFANNQFSKETNAFFKFSNYLSVLLIALTISFLSGIIILFLKKKLSTRSNNLLKKEN